MTAVGNPIEAVLTLNATSFHTGLNDSLKAVQNFKNSLVTFESDVKGLDRLLNDLDVHLKNISANVVKFNESLGNLSSIQKLGDFLLNVSKAMKTFSSDTINLERSMTVINNIFTAWGNTVGNTTVRIEAVSKAVRELSSSAQTTGYNVKSAFEQAKAELMGMQTGLYRTGAVMSDVEARTIYQTQQMKNEFKSARSDLMALANGGAEAFNKILTGVNQVNTTLNSGVNSINMYRVALQGIGTTTNSVVTNLSKLPTYMSYLNATQNSNIATTNSQTVAMERLNLTTSQSSMQFSKLSAEETMESTTKQRETNITNQNTSAHQRNASSMSQATARTNQLTSSTNRLKSAMSSLRMMGNLVGSMLAYNFAHKLLVATGETIHAKSEMEGYFKMLNFGQADIDHFNKALDNTVSQFQRVNKYSLGETISSIGVEFNLTTQEMEKAMKVTSMITSEYLRAGRNANEASLAVKDVLQGQFQRLSRETGVKGEQLKEAGWSGDTSDVLGLMTALEKVGESRNWDVFAEKANSLNDIITILQNRFGEWSADMVNVVQPSIVNTFNAIMSVAQGFANVLSGLWQWLNGGSWGAIATQIGLVSSAILVGVHSLTAWRTGATLTQVANMGLKNSIMGLVLGINAEEMANKGVSASISAHILGLNAEKVAEIGVTNATNQAVFTKGLYKTTTEAETLASQLHSDILVGEATAISLVKDEETGAIILKQGLSIATTENTTTTIGFTGALSMMIAGEQLAEGETLSLAGAMGALTGAFLTSPIGIFTLAVLGLASAFYVASGGLDGMWDSLQSAKSAIDDVDSALKPYKDNVNQTNKELEEAKEKYGENSLIVQQLKTKYDNAKTSLDTYYESLQRTTAQHKRLNDELAVTSAKMDEIMKDKLGTSGLSESEISSLSKDMQDLDLLRDKDYVALQKYHAMLGNYSDDLEKYGKNVNYDKDALKDFNKEYSNFIDYSNKANTADNWWDWMTNSFMAGVSGKSIEIKSLLAELFADPFNAIFSQDKLESLGGINDWLTGIGNAISDFDLGKYFGDIAGGVGEYFGNALGGIGESVQNFINDPLGTLGISLPENWNILSLFGLNPVSAGDGSSDHPSILEDLKQGFGVDIQAFIDGMSTDPLGTLGITGAITDITTFLSQLIPINFESVTGFVQNNLITPFGQAVYNGIMSIPLVGDILALFGLVNGDNSGASQKGNDLATSFKTKLEEVIRNIPILGDILQLLGIIPQANPTASSNGQGVGSSIKTGFKNGLTGMAQIIQDEINHILNALGDAINQAGQKALELGNAIVSGVRNAIDPGSPGIIAREIIGNEFGTYIPQVISNNSEMAYMSAQTYGQSVVDGISSVNFNSFGALATDYESDAQTMISTTQLLGLDTTTAFNDMALAVNTTTNTMGTNVIGTYNSMSTQQSSMLQNMKTQNMTAYNDMYQKSNQSLIHMRDSTSNLTAQMTNAWRYMKDQIVATANQLKSESTTHFNELSNTIGDFYRKIQNPANWGANGRSPNAIPSRSSRSSSGRSIANAITSRSGGRFAGGRDVYNRSLGSSTMTIAQLKRKVCPTGTCDIFDGYSATTRVNPAEFLGMFADDYFFGWNDWNSTHYNYIKNKSDEWEMKSPQIQLMGGIDTNAKYKVGDFENGSPQISFESFQSMAESIFSVIPYRLYYNSDWKGSWLGALQAGACNCWDGAHALLALANTCGFSGSIGSGSWGSYGHVWAIINGKIMDTTAWQGGYGWTSPKVSGYGHPSVQRAMHHPSVESNNNETPTINVTIEGDVYGVDDLESKIMSGVDKGLEKHFNTSYTIGV